MEDVLVPLLNKPRCWCAVGAATLSQVLSRSRAMMTMEGLERKPWLLKDRSFLSQVTFSMCLHTRETLSCGVKTGVVCRVAICIFMYGNGASARLIITSGSLKALLELT